MTTEYAPVPVTVIGGFLGAGKTTYLNRLIQGGLPQDALIIVNDFGDINIDAALIDYQNDKIIQLSNGCVCCTLGGTLAEQLAQALRIRAAPGAILIEASGVADPARIADIARLSRRLRLAEVVCLIDGSQARRHAADPLVGDAWRAQVLAADTLRVNRLAPDDKREFEQWLSNFNPHSNIKYAERNGALPSMDSGARTTTQPRAKSAPLKAVSHEPWRSFSITGNTQIDRQRLASLIDAYADVLFRAKGFVIDGKQGVMLLQYSGKRLHWQSVLRPSAENRLVFIGVVGKRLDEFRIKIELLL